MNFFSQNTNEAALREPQIVIDLENLNFIKKNYIYKYSF